MYSGSAPDDWYFVVTTPQTTSPICVEFGANKRINCKIIGLYPITNPGLSNQNLRVFLCQVSCTSCVRISLTWLIKIVSAYIFIHSRHNFITHVSCEMLFYEETMTMLYISNLYLICCNFRFEFHAQRKYINIYTTWRTGVVT
jgi:hypothetical protein